MLKVTLFGHGGTQPLPERALAAAAVTVGGRSVLLDCGEGTQVGLRRYGVSAYRLSAVLLTHYHGDHILGLPGLFADTGQPEPHRAADDLRPPRHRAGGAGCHGAGRGAAIPGALAGDRRHFCRGYAENHTCPIETPRALPGLCAGFAPRRKIRCGAGKSGGHPAGILVRAAKRREHRRVCARSRCWVRRAAA